MNKPVSILCFCLVYIFFLSCGRPDYDYEISSIYSIVYEEINNDTTADDDRTDSDSGDTASDDADSGDTVDDADDTPAANPCDPNPCASVANSTGGCIQKSSTTYSCECNANYDWNSSSRKCEVKIAECSPINGLMWSSKYDEKDFYDAKDYCESVVTCGENGWRMPTIGELRTLVKNCAKTETGGSCKVTDNCVSSQCDSDNCYLPRCGSSSHSIFGDTNSLWSSSYKLEDDVATTAQVAWKINFTDASINASNTGTTYNFRCVRKAN